MKFIVFHKGITETLAYFSACIARELEAFGYEVFRFEITDETKQLTELRQFLEQGEVTMVTFNFHGIQQEAIFYDDRGELLWDVYQVRCVNILVDHPLYYYKRLFTLPEKYVQMCIDGGHEAYMRKVYPHIRLLPTRPVAGSSPWEAWALAFAGSEKLQRTTGAEKQEESDTTAGAEQPGELERKNIRDRKYDVVFAGNYKPPQEFDPLITRNGPEYEQFYRGILEELFACPDRDINTVFEHHIREAMGELSAEELALAFHCLVFLDMYVRFWFRGEVVRRLTESGIPVHVFGLGWERLKTKRPDCLICHGSQDTADCLEAFAEAKLSLNVMPWFKQGAHDRIYSSMLCGAVSLTDSSRYLDGRFQNGKQLVFYRLEALEELPELAGELLEQEEIMQEIADCGYQYANENLTWRDFVEELSNSLEGRNDR